MRNRGTRPKAATKAPAFNPLAVDPTRTQAERRGLELELRGRYNRLKAAIYALLAGRDGLGLGDAQRYDPARTPGEVMAGVRTAPSAGLGAYLDTPAALSPGTPTGNTDFRYEDNPNKVKRFRAWLRQQMDSDLAGDEVIQRYIDAGYRKGNSRAFDDLRKGNFIPGDDSSALKRQGAKEEFVRMRMSKGATVEKVKLLAGRTFSELEDVNAGMATRMTRVLTDALVSGWSPEKAAREMLKEVDIEQSRALTIVRTELVRAHSEGQLDALADMGEGEAEVQVEWQAGADSRTCPKCAPMAGKVIKLEDARGLIPRHPNCRCAWVPVKQRKAVKR